MGQAMYVLTHNPNIKACRSILKRQSEIGQRALVVMRRRTKELTFIRSVRLISAFGQAIDNAYDGSIPEMVDAFDKALGRKPGWWRY